jgi:flagellin
MSLDINTNIASIDAQRNLANTQLSLNQSMQRLSSGLRINSAADDAAGMAISENMQANIGSMNQAVRNANDGISMTETAEGALNETSSILINMRQLATQASNGTMSSSDLANIGVEFSALQSEITRISAVTSFNGMNLLDGTLSGAGKTLQIGAGDTGNDQLSVTIGKADATTLGVGSGVSVSSQSSAISSLAAIDAAINSVSTMQGNLGTVQNRLQDAISNLQVAVENTTAANSRIVDVDVASETANLSRTQVLEQAGVSVLSQANQLPQLALKLLQ